MYKRRMANEGVVAYRTRKEGSGSVRALSPVLLNYEFAFFDARGVQLVSNAVHVLFLKISLIGGCRRK